MFCKTCQYPLWNLKERTCPECGTGFAPSQFRFRANSIQFLCPHCGQQYYGTSERGHLVPPAFSCVKCERDIEMDQMALVPVAGLDERRTRARGNPWTERAGRPTIRDWFQTTLMSMGAPAPLILATDRTDSLRRTLGYACTTVVLASAASIVMPFMVLLPILAPLGINAKGVLAIAIWAVGVILTGILAFLLIPIAALVAHVVLRGGKPQGGLRTTIHAAALSAGPNVFWGVPLFGIMAGFLGVVWWGISFSVMLRVAHRVSRLRATIAGMLVPTVTIILFVGGFVALMVFSLSAANSAMGTMSNGALTDVGKTTRSLRVANAAAGRERHLGSLLLDGDVLSTDLIGDAFSQTSQISVNGVDLTQLVLTGTDQERAAAAASLDALLTPDVVAYRVGDVVVIRDVPDPAPDPRLWRVAVSLEPVANAMWYPQAMQGASNPFITMGMGGDSNSAINPEVAGQNLIRAAHGLPPLPPLHTITDAAPFRVTESAGEAEHEAKPVPTEAPAGPG